MSRVIAFAFIIISVVWLSVIDLLSIAEASLELSSHEADFSLKFIEVQDSSAAPGGSLVQETPFLMGPGPLSLSEESPESPPDRMFELYEAPTPDISPLLDIPQLGYIDATKAYSESVDDLKDGVFYLPVLSLKELESEEKSYFEHQLSVSEMEYQRLSEPFERMRFQKGESELLDDSPLPGPESGYKSLTFEEVQLMIQEESEDASHAESPLFSVSLAFEEVLQDFQNDGRIKIPALIRGSMMVIARREKE